MSVKVYTDTKIYVACPTNIATGGPELLHQIVYHLRKDLNINAFMYYYDYIDKSLNSPVRSDYIKYNNPYVTKYDEIEDNEKCILIVPEIYTALSLLQKFNKIRKSVWFLSVDNYYLSRLTRKEYLLPIIINKISKNLINKPIINIDITSEKVLNKLIEKYDYRKDTLLKLTNFYMTNSYRGMKWYSDLKPLYYLSEYLNDDFLKIQPELSKKENIVVYNPTKGFSFSKKIIKYEKNIKFVPIKNMTRDEVIKILQKAKVYIDFGNHPGKDRLPREAAILGCCVITGKRGSAAFYDDVSIPDNYKFEDKKENITNIVDKINDCLENYEERYKDFEYYRQVIKNEPQKFIEDLKKIFINF